MPFARYFLICGLEANSGLELEDSQHQNQQSRGRSREVTSTSTSTDFNPLERSYKCSVLRLIPAQSSGEALDNPEALARLILPNGVKFCTQREIENCPPSAHPFVMTRENGEKWLGATIVAYEEVKDSDICHAVHTLQKMHSTELDSGSTGTAKHRRSGELSRPLSSSSSNSRSRSLPRHYQQSRMLSTSTLDLSAASYDYRYTNSNTHQIGHFFLLLSQNVAGKQFLSQHNVIQCRTPLIVATLGPA